MEENTIQRTLPTPTGQREAGEGREWFIVFLRDEFSCVYCGGSPLEDGAKIHSDRLDGEAPDVFQNRVTVCSKCGEVKGSLPLSKTMLAKFTAIIGERSRRFIKERRNQLAATPTATAQVPVTPLPEDLSTVTVAQVTSATVPPLTPV